MFFSVDNWWDSTEEEREQFNRGLTEMEEDQSIAVFHNQLELRITTYNTDTTRKIKQLFEQHPVYHYDEY
jgi:hypothetical protein